MCRHAAAGSTRWSRRPRRRRPAASAGLRCRLPKLPRVPAMNQYSTSLAAEVDAVSTSSQRYDPLERLHVRRPVDRVDFISERCRGKRVLDIGCFDETALVKRDTKHYLHGRISAVA